MRASHAHAYMWIYMTYESSVMMQIVILDAFASGSIVLCTHFREYNITFSIMS